MVVAATASIPTIRANEYNLCIFLYIRMPWRQIGIEQHENDK